MYVGPGEISMMEEKRDLLFLKKISRQIFHKTLKAFPIIQKIQPHAAETINVVRSKRCICEWKSSST